MTYKLVWQDLFDIDGLPNPEIWNIEIGGGGFGNNEDQFYTNNKKNIYIKDHILHIVGHKEVYENRFYTSAKITTRNKKEMMHGRIEVMAKVPRGAGTWPAIWLLGTDIKDKGWPMCGEIDMMEHVGHNEGFLHFSLHSKTFNHIIRNQPTYIHKEDRLLDDFHEYAINWDENQISFFVDNIHMATFSKDNQTNEREWPFNKPYFLILNLALGGTWGGPIDDSIFPVDFKFKYVKVYEKGE